MKILLFINSLGGGGAERFCVVMAHHWAQMGHEVVVATLEEASSDVYDLRPPVRRIVIGGAGQSRSTLSAIGNSLARGRRLSRCLAAERPDVALAIMARNSTLLALTRRHGVPVRVGAERCYPPDAPLSRPWALARRLAYGRLDAVVAQTDQGAAWLRRHSHARVALGIPNPVSYPLPEGPPNLAPEAALAPQDKLLLSVGRLDPVKAFDRLIAAFGAQAKAHPDWRLAIIGEGPDRARLEALVAAEGLADRVLLPGRAGNVGAWYRRADLFALTSLSEGFPNALIEAMSHGVAALSVDCQTGPRDVIRDGQDGLLVPQDDPVALRAALGRLMQDDATRARMAQEALDVRARFAIDAVSQQWLELFARLGA